MAIELKRHKKLIYYDDGTIFKQVKIKPEGPRPPHENYQHLNQIFSILEQDDVNGFTAEEKTLIDLLELCEKYPIKKNVCYNK